MSDVAPQNTENISSFEGWRASFLSNDDHQAPHASPDQKIDYADTYAKTVLLTPISWIKAQETSSAGDLFTFVWAPFERAAEISIEKEIETWFSVDGMDAGRRLVRVSIRTARIYWRKDKAVIFCDRERIGDVQDAVLRFTLTQQALLDIEGTVRAFWPNIEQLDDLSPQSDHKLAQNSLMRSRHLAAEATRLKAKYLRLSLAVEQNNFELSDSSKRLFEELVTTALVYERLEALENPVQFFLDYGVEAHGRWLDILSSLKERQYYLIGIAMEAAIVIVLIIGLLKSL